MLREKQQKNPQIRIGSTKSQSHQHLTKAIREGSITLNDLHEWAEQIEGWGRQHVYLYHVPTEVAELGIWKRRAILASIAVLASALMASGIVLLVVCGTGSLLAWLRDRCRSAKRG